MDCEAIRWRCDIDGGKEDLKRAGWDTDEYELRDIVHIHKVGVQGVPDCHKDTASLAMSVL